VSRPQYICVNCSACPGSSAFASQVQGLELSFGIISVQTGLRVFGNDAVTYTGCFGFFLIHVVLRYDS
jgi:hypothetical protein